MCFANHFIPSIPPVRPVVLFIDGHGSHLEIETFPLAQKNGIDLYALLKNVTHLVQPADTLILGIRQSQNSANGTQMVTSTREIAVQSQWENGRMLCPSIVFNVFCKSGI